MTANSGMNHPRTTQSGRIQPTMPDLDIPGLKLHKEIGRGGMARVYLAMQESLQRPVAIKLLDNPDTPGFHERFLNEGRLLAALSHPGIVEVHDIGEYQGNYFIVMEYLPGGDLRSRILQGLKPGMALRIALRIAACLDYLHQQGMVHRDLKPANILFRANGSPVITDFGIAKLLQQDGDLTQSGGILGSPSYLSPEQAGFAGDVDGRSDLYSLGIILFEMLTGERPFKGENFAEILMAHHRVPIPRLPGQLAELQDIVDHLLAKQAIDRYQTGAELVQALRNLTTEDDPAVAAEPSDKRVPTPGDQEIRTPSASARSPLRGLKWAMTSLIAAGLLLTSLPGADSSSELSLRQVPQTQAQGVEAQLPMEQPSVEMALEEQQPVPGNQTPPLAEMTDTAPKPAPQVTVAKRRVPSKRQVKHRLSKADRLLKKAYQRMDSLRLSLPRGDSAYDYFKKILEIDPQNKPAKAGMRQIVRWYIDKAEQSLSQNKTREAQRYVNRARVIDKDHPRLVALQNRINGPAVAEKKPFNPFRMLNF